MRKRPRDLARAAGRLMRDAYILLEDVLQGLAAIKADRTGYDQHHSEQALCRSKSAIRDHILIRLETRDHASPIADRDLPGDAGHLRPVDADDEPLQRIAA